MARMYVASPEEVKAGRVTDIYFIRTREIIEAEGLGDVTVRMEAHVYGLPKGYEWAVFAGLEEVVYLLEGKPVTLYSMPEGTVFRDREPLMILEGKYKDLAVLETPLLGVVRHYTSIATKAARVKKLAGDKQVIFFGLRALHPAIMPMADRAALIGGLDGVSGAMSKDYLGVEPKGTMPHALILVVGDPVKAWLAFDRNVEPEVPRIALVDTFYDERYEALLAARTLGDKLWGVRLDTPSSRRGNFKKLIEEVRWSLDIHGFRNVKIFVSGGINERLVKELREIVDGFGVGTSIAFPPSIDVSMDIVEVKRDGRWVPYTKRGKLPGAKQVYRCEESLEDYVTLLDSGEPSVTCRDGSRPKPLLTKVIDEGKLVARLPDVTEIRKYVLAQLAKLPEPQPAD